MEVSMYVIFGGLIIIVLGLALLGLAVGMVLALRS